MQESLIEAWKATELYLLVRFLSEQSIDQSKKWIGSLVCVKIKVEVGSCVKIVGVWNKCLLKLLKYFRQNTLLIKKYLQWLVLKKLTI